MYCSTCGVAVVPGLSYCNYCGAKLSAAKGDSVAKSPEVKPETLIGAITALFIFGLVAITMLMGVMKVVLEVEIERVLAFSFFPFLLMVLLEGVFIRLLLRRKRGAEDAGEMLLKGQATRELDAAQAGVLPEHMPSVTEHTTRAFAPVHNELTSK